MPAPTLDFVPSSGLPSRGNPSPGRSSQDRSSQGRSVRGETWISVGEVMSPPGASLPASATVWTTVTALLQGGHDRVWLTDPEGCLAGEVTSAALLYAEIRGVPGERPVATLSDPVAPLNGHDDAATAVVRLGRGGEDRVPVTRDGVLIGELGRNDVLSLVHGVRRVAAAADIPLPTAEPEATTVGPAPPRFLSLRAGERAGQARR